MPNWCKNRLTVTGPVEALNSFVQRARGVLAQYRDDVEEAGASSEESAPMVSELCFHSLVPVPAEILEAGYSNEELLRRQGFNSSAWVCWLHLRSLHTFIGHLDLLLDGSHWQTSYWGTKWEPTVHSVSRTDEAIHYAFDTAWSPPLALLDRVAQDFPTLTFSLRFFEPGCDFAGHALWRRGERVEFDNHSVRRDDFAEWGDDSRECCNDPEDGDDENTVDGHNQSQLSSKQRTAEEAVSCRAD